ncbi:MAG: tRNA (N6-isopentenyl adenosine(37)-C2)-methylthiotransferase MiaB [Acidobacteriota bacterium]|nr:MAG: tRNA (N6-isopentenyl adenosine(37)-C2)-methylthiotransferase MiaB [Acidobacteriota bacterium]
MEAPKRYFVETWGCQMNDHDSEKLAGHLERRGYRTCAAAEEADVILLNTCSVRGKAAEKFYSDLGRLKLLKRRRPDLLLVVCGCVAQHDRERVLERAPYVDVVLGTRGTNHLPELLDRRIEEQTPQVDMRRYADALYYDPRYIRRGSKVKAYITAMEGCSKVCTFCIVPVTRGAEVSRPFEDVLAEARLLAERGYKEVQILGQNVSSYSSGGRDFADLLEAVARVKGLERVRFVTSYPSEFTERTMDVMAAYDTIAKALHFPVQAGSNRVLRRMKRFYTREEYLEKAALLRKKMPRIALSTDVIVGFPGETEEDFQETMSLVREAGFEWMYSFKYSPRRGTPAARYEDTVPEAAKRDRLERLQAMHRPMQERALRACEGRTEEVLVEDSSKRGGGALTGRTEANYVVNFPGDAALVGRLVPVRIERANPNSLWGEVVSNSASRSLLGGARPHGQAGL